MTKRFNVIDEPWLAVRAPDGTVSRVGLREALVNAHRHAGLAEASPPNLVALHRMLLALLNRALVRDGVAWEPRTWWEKGLPEKAIVEYLEDWRERFWVFHPEHPFMQVAALQDEPETKDQRKPWTVLALDRATGNTPLVFDHTQDDVPPLADTGTVLRNLIGLLQCTPGSLVRILRHSDKAGPLADTAAILPQGGNLCRTLLLALHRTGGANDLPTWEQPAPPVSSLKGNPTMLNGLNDRYTRRTRAVLLIPADEAGGHVQHVRFAAGLAIEDSPQIPEPMAAYRMGASGPIRLSLREGRALWRDLPALIPDAGAEKHLHPCVLDTAAQRFAEVNSDMALVPVLAAGIASDQAKLERWRCATIVLPKAMLTASEPSAALRALVSEAEATGGALRKIAGKLTMKAFPRAAKGWGMANALPMQPVFYAKLEQTVPELVRLLGEGREAEAKALWRSAQADAARQAWKSTCAALGASIPAIKAVAQVQWKHDALVLGLLKAAKGETVKEESA